MEEYKKTKVLILVKTYPVPSGKHGEVACTAGITENAEWVRLYPIPFRSLGELQKYQKYQWVEVELAPKGSANDMRKESRKVKINTIKPIDPPIPPGDNWRARRKLVDQLPVRTLNEFKTLYNSDKTSLGVVRPARVLDLKIEPVSPVWSEKQQAILNQPDFFRPQTKALAKLPYKFSYQFECEDSDKAHNAMIEDWELGALYLKEAHRLGGEKAAAESVRKKYLDEMCSDQKDTRFFMGTAYPYDTWLVLGVFWPPKEGQLELDFGE